MNLMSARGLHQDAMDPCNHENLLRSLRRKGENPPEMEKGFNENDDNKNKALRATSLSSIART